MSLSITDTGTGVMGTKNPKAKDLVTRFNKLSTSRANWEDTWQQLRLLVRPSVPDFFSKNQVKGEKLSNQIYDGTAIWALDQLAGGMHSFLTNPSDQWFMINIRGEERENLPLPVRNWLHEVENIIFNEYQRPQTSFTSSMHEAYLDIGCFGTCALYQYYNQRTNSLRFRTYPLSDVWMQENADGTIDVVFRRLFMTFRQMEQEWDDVVSKCPKAFKEAGTDTDSKEFTVVHATFPRDDRVFGSELSTNMPIASFYFILETEEILSESGFRNQPYHTGRWSKLAGETYGRSPGSVSLPDIRMVNQLTKTIIVAAQKMTDPPVVLPSEGFMTPLKTAPGSVIWKEPGIEEAAAWPMQGQPEIGIEVLNQHRQQIVRAFFVEFLTREKKRERQTAFEVQDERAEMLQMLAPIMGRVQSELLGPMIRRSFNLLQEHNRIPDPPFEDAELVVEYNSPAARAQLGAKSLAAKRYVQDLMSVAQIDPSVLAAVDMRKFAKMIGRFEDIPPEILRSDREIQAILQQQAQQQQARLNAETMAQGAKATRDIAEARAKDPSI